jgi:hypothetical protein
MGNFLAAFLDWAPEIWFVMGRRTKKIRHSPSPLPGGLGVSAGPSFPVQRRNTLLIFHLSGLALAGEERKKDRELDTLKPREAIQKTLSKPRAASTDIIDELISALSIQ